MHRILILVAALFLTSCAGDLEKLRAVYTVATTAVVPASVVRPAANTFDILKGTAVNFARYCVSTGNTATGCDVDTRRRVVKFVKQGTKARIQLRAAVESGQPALSTVYNLLVDAVTGLQATPVATFTGG